MLKEGGGRGGGGGGRRGIEALGGRSVKRSCALLTISLEGQVEAHVSRRLVAVM